MANLVIVCFEYVNHRGVYATRHVVPSRIRFGTGSYYTKPSWLLDAYDLDKKAELSFAVAKIRNWRPAE